MTSEQLSMVAGMVLSLLFSYAPGLKTWYDELNGEGKSLVMLAALVVVSVGIFGLSCYGPFDWVACTQKGAWGLVTAFFYALALNQTTYVVTRKVGGS